MPECIKIKKSDKLNVLNFKKTLKCHNITAHLLSNRQINTIDEANAFLYPPLKNIKPPFSIIDMDIAVERIFNALKANEKILVFGDYDVDGVTSTIVLLDFLNYINANVGFYIPDRIDEGYSLRAQHFKNEAIMKDVRLIITVDCGIENAEAATVAKERGIDIIITDHHEVSGDEDYEVFAFVNPKRKDCSSGLNHLAGVGVAFYLVMAMRKFLRDKKFWDNYKEPNLKSYCELVTLGTIADMVPLINENRVFTRIGFDIIKNTKRLGLQTLMNSCNIEKESMHSEDISFKIAPRINAAGRIKKASIAVDLLRSKDFVTAKKMTQNLQDLNNQRQKIEREILENIKIYLKDNPEKLKNRAIILSNYVWHNGVLGIVSSRLAQFYKKPALLIAIKNGIGKGSARSVKGFDLYEAFYESREFVKNFGGHSMAAGFTIEKENIPLFIKKFQEITDRHKEIDSDKKEIVVDYEINFNEISEKFLNELEIFQPFGMENPEPIFITRNVNVVSSFLIQGKHLRLALNQKNSHMDAIFFNYDKNEKKIKNDFIPAIAFKLSWNKKQNRKMQIIIKDILTENLEVEK